ncbi:MAG: hypothetical protein II797_04510 [Clostridia bacterium]|nr:hypothetical protein [Clostridia bacterium]
MKIYFDMDGVLADFNRGVSELCGLAPVDQEKHGPEEEEKMWDAIRQTDRFYDRLEPVEGSIRLFLDLREKYGKDVEILTGIPKPRRNIPTAGEDKVSWVRRYLSPDVKVRLVLRKEKKYCVEGGNSYLIDDYRKNIREWEEAGGTGILFTSAEETREKLKELGLL